MTDESMAAVLPSVPGVHVAAPAPVAAASGAVIEAWFFDLIHNSPVSRDTEIYNHVRAAVDALKQRLSAL